MEIICADEMDENIVNFHCDNKYFCDGFFFQIKPNMTQMYNVDLVD